MSHSRDCISSVNFPTVVFPNMPEWMYDKKRNLGLNEYGSWEAVDLQFIEGRQILLTKKSRTTALIPDEISVVLTPQHDQELLYQPQAAETGCSVTYDNRVPVSGQLKSKHIDRKIRFKTLQMEKEFLRSIEGASSVFSEEFENVLERNTKITPLRKWMKRKLKLKFNAKTFVEQFDPTCFGIGKKLFSDLLQEDCLQSMKNRLNDQGTVSGGCLSYRSIAENRTGSFGILICAQGDGMNELSIKATHADFDKNHSEMCNSNSYRNRHTNLETCSEITQTLNGRILSVDNVIANDGDVLISAMSDYSAIVNTFHLDRIAFDWDQRDVHFSDNSLCPSGLLRSSGHDPVSSLALNPYVHGECVVATQNGMCGLWKIDAQHHCDVSNGMLQINVNYERERVCLKQISYAAHPRQFVGCDQNMLYLFDIRSQSSPCCLFDAHDSTFLNRPENIYASQSCKSAGNEYEIILATDNNLLLMDLRYSHEPLLKWDACVDFPACYLKCLQSLSDNSRSDFVGSNRQYSNSLLLTGGRTTDKVYYYQINRLSNCTSNVEYSSPPFSVAPPRLIESSPTLPDLSTKLKYSLPGDGSLDYTISGFDGTSFENGNASSVCIFQLTSSGEIFYHTLGQSRQDADSYQDSRNRYNILDTNESVPKKGTHSGDSNSSKVDTCRLRLWHSDLTDNPYLSEQERAGHCEICASEEPDVICIDDEICDATSLMVPELCKHRSLGHGNETDYSVREEYFHSSNVVRKLQLINVDTPNEPTDLGRSLLESWNDT